MYTENVHWGHSYAFDASIQTSSIPTLGLLTLDETIQSTATTAIRMDDVQTLRALNIGYAVSSPIGTIALTLGPSPYWSMEQSFQGARYWKLWDEPSPSHVTFAVALNTTTCEVMKGCNMEQDPWRNHRFNDPLDRGEYRIVLDRKGTYSWENVVDDVNVQGLHNVCFLYEQIGDFNSYRINVNDQALNLNKNSGWNHECINVQINQTLDVDIEMTQDGTFWINPLGFSGRSSEIIDSTGLRIHHIELKRVNNPKA